VDRPRRLPGGGAAGKGTGDCLLALAGGEEDDQVEQLIGGAVAVVGGGIEGKTETATMYVFRALNDRNEIGAYSMSLLLGVTAIIVLLVMRLLRRSVVREQTAYVNHIR